MKYIYIENYITLQRHEKMNFLRSMNTCKDFKVSIQNVIYSEESLLLSLLENSDIQEAYNYFKDFFKNIENIKIDLVDKKPYNDQAILTFISSNKKIIIQDNI